MLWASLLALLGVVSYAQTLQGVNLGGWLVVEGWLFPDWTDTNGDSWRSTQTGETVLCLGGCFV